MTDRRRRRRWLLLGALAASPIVMSGCTRASASLEITSYKDPYFPETYQVELADCAYYVDPGGDYHIAGYASHTPADGGGGTIEQLMHLHLFWKPWPGKTFDNPTTVDATLRYAIVTGQGAAVYCGTGFVYPRKRRMSDDLIVQIEAARLRLEAQLGDPPELLGDARVVGELVAEHNASRTVDLRRRLDLYAGLSESK